MNRASLQTCIHRVVCITIAMCSWFLLHRDFPITITALKGNESTFNLMDFYRNKPGVLLSAYILEDPKEK